MPSPNPSTGPDRPSAGVLGLIDDVGDPEQDNASLHRLDVAAGMPILQAAGFEMESSDLLRNSEDDHMMRVDPRQDGSRALQAHEADGGRAGRGSGGRTVNA